MFKPFKRVALMVLALMVVGSGVLNAAINHVVESGESVWLISRKYDTTVAAVAGANELADANLIYCGQKLLIPERHKVLPGETLWLISREYNTTVAAITGASGLTNPELLHPGQILKVADAPESSSGGDQTPPTPSRGGRLSQADLDLFARLVQAESAGEPYTGQVAVAATVLNRVSDSRYPDTVRGVIMQVWGGCFQYSPVEDGRINQAAGESAYRAVEEALNGADPTNGATGFYNPAKTGNLWVRMQPVTVTIGSHVFFR